MITQQVPKRDKDNPWFNILERKAKHWNDFAKKMDIKINGSYNYYQLIIKGFYNFPDGLLK